jgi:hypothetical protein
MSDVNESKVIIDIPERNDEKRRRERKKGGEEITRTQTWTPSSARGRGWCVSFEGAMPLWEVEG